MKVYVERCTGKFRLTLPCGSREFISNPEGDLWCRKFATEALDILENLYGATRRNVRFEHY